MVEVNGTVTAGDVLALSFASSSAPNGAQRSILYTVQTNDTTTTIAANFATAITNDPVLSSIGVSATPGSPEVKVTKHTFNLMAVLTGISCEPVPIIADSQPSLYNVRLCGNAAATTGVFMRTVLEKLYNNVGR